MDLEDFFDQIDLSALAANEQQGFKDWLGERPSMKFSIENALRKGQSVKAYIHIYRKQVEYAVRIENWKEKMVPFMAKLARANFAGLIV